MSEMQTAPAGSTAGSAVDVPSCTPRFTYTDCLTGKAGAPADKLGKLVFQVLMVGGMVSIMATFNGVRHLGLDFFVHFHWFYPLVFTVAFLLRLALANRLVDAAIPRFILPRFQGIARGVAITVLNVCVMAPLMAALVTLLLMGPANFWGQFADSLPISMAVATIVNFFVVGPVVKLLYYNAISSTANGMRFLRFVQDNAMPWLLISNS